MANDRVGHIVHAPANVKVLEIHAGSPPTCTVEINGKRKTGIRMVIGPNGWKPLNSDLLDHMGG